MEVKISKGVVVDLQHGDILLDNGACVQFWSNHRNGRLTAGAAKAVRKSDSFRQIVGGDTKCPLIEFTTPEGLAKEAEGLPYAEFIQLPVLKSSPRIEIKYAGDSSWYEGSIVHATEDMAWISSDAQNSLVFLYTCKFRRVVSHEKN